MMTCSLPRLLGAAVVLLGAACAGGAGARRDPLVTPSSAADVLLAADRGFAAASAATDAVTALSAMFDAEVILPVGSQFVNGSAAAVEALRRNPANARTRLEWQPIRVGISADGQHGFTLGYMTAHIADSARVPMKYLAYWIKRPEGWRVAAYRRRPRHEGVVSMAMMPPALPPRTVPPTSDAAVLERHRESLARAEREFSSTAQQIGIGPAFERFGSADAVNMGGPTDTAFVVGSRAIGRSVGAGFPGGGSPVSWAPDHAVLVASSGDLGVTFGFIRPNAPPAGQPAPAIPFFTIWRRATPADPWRYVAE